MGCHINMVDRMGGHISTHARTHQDLQLFFGGDVAANAVGVGLHVPENPVPALREHEGVSGRVGESEWQRMRE